LRSDDPPSIRARRIMQLLAYQGDPADITEIEHVIADVLAVYREIDGLAYDGALDSYRSYEAAIAAIRRRKEAGHG
jgi:hypothetical protein